SGTPAIFSVVANGTAPFSYQWRKGGAAISGATNDTFVIPVAVAADAGTYSVVVNNSSNSVTSGNASLTVLPPVGVSITNQPASQSIEVGKPVTFTVGVAGSRPVTYQWYRGNSPIAGATNASFTINAVQTSDQAGYKVVVANSVNQV